MEDRVRYCFLGHWSLSNSRDSEDGVETKGMGGKGQM